MADGTYLLMANSAKPFDELGDDERIQISGLQDRGFTAERLEFPRVNVFSSVVPTPKQDRDLQQMREQMRLSSHRLNNMTLSVLGGYGVHVWAGWMRGDGLHWIALLLGVALVLAIRFQPLPFWKREVR